jgi:hypothetical protein
LRLHCHGPGEQWGQGLQFNIRIGVKGPDSINRTGRFVFSIVPIAA